ncbi:patatin family protein [Clostridium sp. MSJ-8]|uniref:patatin-like phospholipase family protein n=1 Tax=Clostridium sp. MSJ-8 TaxID=2841510 RepID=UPI001C0F35B8|nr:patatin family protein [Clostridium sp. MSJ-8]MBU5487590.1 patatin family protein [Clostridium sp. MSJ-8]
MGKIGLVLEGGGQRGIYTAGVLDVLMENDIYVDGVIGVSAGAIRASSYVTKQIGREYKYTMDYCKDKRYMSIYSLIKTGDIVGKEFCYSIIPKELNKFDYEGFRKSDIDYYVTCSNLETGEAEYIKCTDLDNERDSDYLRASASLPLVSTIVEVDGKKLLDGATCDSIPVMAFRKMGYLKNIVVLTRPKGYKKSKEKMMNIIKRKYKKYPKYIKRCAERHEMYNKTLKDIKKLEDKKEAIVIAPSKNIKISRMEKNTKKLQELYELGRKDALDNLEKIQKFFKV